MTEIWFCQRRDSEIWFCDGTEEEPALFLADFDDNDNYSINKNNNYKHHIKFVI